MYIYGSQRGKRNKIKSGLYMHGPSYLGMDAVRFVLSIYMVLDRFCRTPCPCAPIGCELVGVVVGPVWGLLQRALFEILHLFFLVYRLLRIIRVILVLSKLNIFHPLFFLFTCCILRENLLEYFELEW